MTTTIKKILIELEQLNSKITKLENFIDSVSVNDITSYHKELLILQLTTMKSYYSCLNLRLQDLIKDQ